MGVAIEVLATVLFFAVLIFFLAMWARLVLDWVRVLQPSWRPRGVVLVLAEFCYLITDPPVKGVRRIVPPLRLGAVQIDLAWSIVLLLTLLAFSAVGWLRQLA